VLNRSFHAHLYEFGTGPRSVADGTPVRVKVNGQWVTVKGTGRGSMPAANVFVPTIERERERVAGELGDVLRDPRVTGGLRTMAVR
jgi:hypothetical protein